MPGQPVGAGVELGVGGGAALAREGGRLGGGDGVRGHERRDRRRSGAGSTASSARPMATSAVALVVGQQVDLADRAVGVVGERLEGAAPAGGPRPRPGGGAEHVGAVLEGEGELGAGLDGHGHRVVGGVGRRAAREGEGAGRPDVEVVSAVEAARPRPSPAVRRRRRGRSGSSRTRPACRRARRRRPVAGARPDRCAGGRAGRPARPGGGRGGRRAVRPDRGGPGPGRVLMNTPIIDSMPGDLGRTARHRGAEHDVAAAGEPGQQQRPRRR